MGRRRRFIDLCELSSIDLMPYRPRHAAPPRLIRPLLRTWLARVLLPPAPMQTRDYLGLVSRRRPEMAASHFTLAR
jgi:hypothetical protein